MKQRGKKTTVDLYFHYIFEQTDSEIIKKKGGQTTNIIEELYNLNAI